MEVCKVFDLNKETSIKFVEKMKTLLDLEIVIVDDWYQVSHHGVDVSYRAVRDGFIKESKIKGNLGVIQKYKIS